MFKIRKVTRLDRKWQPTKPKPSFFQKAKFSPNIFNQCSHQISTCSHFKIHLRQDIKSINKPYLNSVAHSNDCLFMQSEAWFLSSLNFAASRHTMAWNNVSFFYSLQSSPLWLDAKFSTYFHEIFFLPFLKLFALNGKQW